MLNRASTVSGGRVRPILNNVVVIAMFLSLPRLVDGPITLKTVVNDPQLVLYIGLGTTAHRDHGAGPVAGPAARRRALEAGLCVAAHSSTHDGPSSGWTIGYVIANQIALWVVLVLTNGESAGAFVYLTRTRSSNCPTGCLPYGSPPRANPTSRARSWRRTGSGSVTGSHRGMRLILTLMIPAAALYIGLAQPIVAALLQRGAFDASDTERVADTLRMFAIGLPTFSLYLYSLRGFYSMQDTRTPFLLNCLENALDINCARCVLSPFSDCPVSPSRSPGRARRIATLVTMTVMSRRLGGLRGRQIGATAFHVGIVGVAVGAVTWLIADRMGSTTPTEAILTTIVGTQVGIAIGISQACG